jgi:uncharacterized membrane protein (DUF373 family)
MLNCWTRKETIEGLFEQLIRTLLCVLILGILAAILLGISLALGHLATGLTDLAAGRDGTTEAIFRTFLVDVLTVLAMIEVYRTAMAYFTEGRVKVTYIIDTVLVAVLTEVLAFWYRDVEIERMLMLVVLVMVLMALRILAIRFSPYRRRLADGL